MTMTSDVPASAAVTAPFRNLAVREGATMTMMPLGDEAGTVDATTTMIPLGGETGTATTTMIRNDAPQTPIPRRRLR
jgi:hypothetical protein